MYRCRLCDSKSEIVEILDLDNFPKSAQHFLDSDKIESDASITLSIAQCLECGLIQTQNPPIDNYTDVISAAIQTQTSKNAIKLEFNNLFERYNFEPNHILEVGCGSGNFLEVLQEMRLNAEGIESNEENVQLCRRKNLNVKKGNIFEKGIVTKKFDLIVLNNYLEHQPSVIPFLKKVMEFQHEDGLIYISVPSLDRIIKTHNLYEFIADHLSYFTKITLRDSLIRAGLEVLDITMKNNENDIVAIAQKHKKLNLSLSLKHLDELKLNLKSVLDDIHESGKSVCVWGAGHRALALMAICNMQHVSAVVDSAKFKQGRLTPILHKPVISPERFLECGYDVIILMLPGSYGKEALDYLNQRNFPGEIILFDDQKIVRNMK